MDDYLAKPLRAAELAAVLSPYWSSGGQLAPPKRPAPPPPADLLDETTIGSLANLGDKMGKDLLAKVAATYLRASPEILATLQAAFARGDAEAGRQAAHSLKGSSGAMGAIQVSRVAAEMEAMLKAGALDEARPLLDKLTKYLEDAMTELQTRLGDRLKQV
jgi:HPt (histidine-containing phosphotransfer) domain-containing protein